MSRTRVFLRGAFATFCLLVFSSGCLNLTQRSSVSTLRLCDAFHGPTDAEVETEGFAAMHKRLTAGLEKTKDPEMIRLLHLRLAALLIDHRNPDPDYSRARLEIEQSLSIASDGNCLDQAKSIHAILKRLETSGTDLVKTNRSLSRRVKSLSGKLNVCSGELAACNDTVLRLQEIDMQMERKRRDLR